MRAHALVGADADGSTKRSSDNLCPSWNCFSVRSTSERAFGNNGVSIADFVWLVRIVQRDAISPYSVLGHHQPEHIRLLRVSVMDNPSLVWTFVQLLGRHEAMLELSRYDACGGPV